MAMGLTRFPESKFKQFLIGGLIVALLLFIYSFINDYDVGLMFKKTPIKGRDYPIFSEHGDVTEALKSPYPEWITSYLPNNVKEYTNANISTLFKIFYSFADAVEIPCLRRVRLGKLGDGGWDVCDYGRMAPQKPCLIYSFGIAGDWSFDDAAEQFYQCEIHSFDPTIGKKDHNRSKLITFHATGLGGKDSNDKWKMRTLSSIKKELGHENKTIDVLKMDIEGSEWVSLPTSIDDLSLSTVKQLAVEFHFSTRKEDSLRGIDVLLKLYNFGFRKFSSINNIHNFIPQKYYKGSVTSCVEAAYINTRFPNKKQKHISFK